jgi:hypothetical protein
MVLIIQILGACVSTGVPLTSNQVQFKTVGKIPIIEGKINGKRAYFIVDTGASISLLNESEAKHFGFGASSETGHTLVGFSGESKIKEAYNCTVEFGAMTIRGVTFKARCMKDFTAVIHQYESIKISGIIGSDVFDKYRITIDYRNSTISF